jgi:uncharacterized protein YbbC (DUF1343 family)
MKTIFLFFISIPFAFTQPQVKSGADVLFESHMNSFEGKRIGLVTNHTAILSSGKHLADALAESPNIKLVALFGPEHGIRGDNPDGDNVKDSIDSKTGIRVYSLYGKVDKPTPEMLKNIDVLLYDIQDVGVRFYTYISTMMLCMEASAENNVPFVVLDRPNPINGIDVEGPIRVDSLKTFVGWIPIPIRYGMTSGELATLANQSGWLNNGVKANLTVIKMNGWKRSMWYDETGLEWIKPSPNMPTLQTATVYPGTCLVEGVNVTEGRGTEKPFEYIGAPWIDGKILSEKLNGMNLHGVEFLPINFTPRAIKNATSNPKYKEIRCEGIYVHVTDRNSFKSVETGVAIVAAIHSLYPDSLQFRNRGFDRLAGTPVVREMIESGKNFSEIVAIWKSELNEFEIERKEFLLYP